MDYKDLYQKYLQCRQAEEDIECIFIFPEEADKEMEEAGNE